MKKNISTRVWDAKLNTDKCDRYNNAELTLILRIGFRQINPSNRAATGTFNDYGAAQASQKAKSRKIVKWTPNAWQSWKHQFVQSAQKYWHGRFWLINNYKAYEYKDNGITYIPNIWCQFTLIEKDYNVGGNYHHVIDVVHLDKSERWFGSHSRLYDNLDSALVQKGRDSKGRPIMQRAHVHEIGHLLGLKHVDVGKPHCPESGDTNARACYGITDTDKNSVLGQGMQLRIKHANPWRHAIITMAGKGSILSQNDWMAKMTRHYPRTHEDIISNRHFKSKPNRS